MGSVERIILVVRVPDLPQLRILLFDEVTPTYALVCYRGYIRCEGTAVQKRSPLHFLPTNDGGNFHECLDVIARLKEGKLSR